MSLYKPTGIKKVFHNTRRFIARNWLSQQKALQIAITGSQGKTNTTKILTAILESLGKTVVTDLNLDTTFNVPITALKVRPDTEFVMWELGIDYRGEMDRHLEIAKPKIGIITGISPVHTDAEHMGSLENLISEKRKLIEALPANGFAILNYDDINVREMAPFTKANVLWYGTDPEHCNIWTEKNGNAIKTHITVEGTEAYFHDKDQSFTAKTPLIGLPHIYNLMAGYLVMKTIMKKENIQEEFKAIAQTLQPLRGRMNLEDGPLGIKVLNDSLRANPASTDFGLKTLAQIEYTKGRKIAVIGEMGELEKPEDEHAKTGELIAQLPLDFVLCIGPLRKFTIETAIEKGFPQEKIMYASDVFEAAKQLKSILKKNDLMYLKGSLLRNYKRILQLLNNEEVCCHEIMCPYSHCGYKN